MDAEALFQTVSDSADFILFTTDGTMADYRMAKNHHIQWFKSLSSLKVTTIAEQFRFLSGNVVVCAWHTTFDMTFKAGGLSKMDFAITFIFNKIENRWKVMYQQTAAVPSALVKPTE